MKKIGSIDIDDAPLGMMIYNKKNKKYYIAEANQTGGKRWVLCNCKNCSIRQKGGFLFDKKNTTALPTANYSDILAPSPEQHSWQHHHAPFYQVFNNYVCVKRDTLGEIRDFFTEMFSSKNYGLKKPPFEPDSKPIYPPS